MDLRPQEAAQEALTFDISMIPFEAALRRTQFNTTVKSNCSRTTMFTTIRNFNEVIFVEHPSFVSVSLVFAEKSKVEVTSKSDES